MVLGTFRLSHQSEGCLSRGWHPPVKRGVTIAGGAGLRVSLEEGKEGYKRHLKGELFCRVIVHLRPGPCERGYTQSFGDASVPGTPSVSPTTPTTPVPSRRTRRYLLSTVVSGLDRRRWTPHRRGTCRTQERVGVTHLLL